MRGTSQQRRNKTREGRRGTSTHKNRVGDEDADRLTQSTTIRKGSHKKYDSREKKERDEETDREKQRGDRHRQRPRNTNQTRDRCAAGGLSRPDADLSPDLSPLRWELHESLEMSRFRLFNSVGASARLRPLRTGRAVSWPAMCSVFRYYNHSRHWGSRRVRSTGEEAA